MKNIPPPPPVPKANPFMKDHVPEEISGGRREKYRALLSEGGIRETMREIKGSPDDVRHLAALLEEDYCSLGAAIAFKELAKAGFDIGLAVPDLESMLHLENEVSTSAAVALSHHYLKTRQQENFQRLFEHANSHVAEGATEALVYRHLFVGSMEYVYGLFRSGHETIVEGVMNALMDMAAKGHIFYIDEFFRSGNEGIVIRMAGALRELAAKGSEPAILYLAGACYSEEPVTVYIEGQWALNKLSSYALDAFTGAKRDALENGDTYVVAKLEAAELDAHRDYYYINYELDKANNSPLGKAADTRKN